MKTNSLIFRAAPILIMIALYSCKSQVGDSRDKIVITNVEEYLKPKLNDPNSYEFVKLHLRDSILFKDNIKYRKESFQTRLEHDKNELESQLRYQTEIPSMYNEKDVQEAQKNIIKNESVLAEIDSLEKLLGDRVNEVASYTFIYSFRSNNSFGAKVLNEYILQTDPSPSFKVINLAENEDKVFLNPNDFPGYKEMITKYIGN